MQPNATLGLKTRQLVRVRNFTNVCHNLHQGPFFEFWEEMKCSGGTWAGSAAFIMKDIRPQSSPVEWWLTVKYRTILYPNKCLQKYWLKLYKNKERYLRFTWIIFKVIMMFKRVIVAAYLWCIFTPKAHNWRGQRNERHSYRSDVRHLFVLPWIC